MVRITFVNSPDLPSKVLEYPDGVSVKAADLYIVGDTDALDESQWNTLFRLDATVIRKRFGREITVKADDWLRVYNVQRQVIGVCRADLVFHVDITPNDVA